MWHNQAILSQADISLNGTLRELEHLATALADFCLANTLDDEAEFQLNLVLEELFVNAIRHGGCEGMSDAARVRLSATAGGVAVEFRDRGRPFDPSAAIATGRLWRRADEQDEQDERQREKVTAGDRAP